MLKEGYCKDVNNLSIHFNYCEISIIMLKLIDKILCRWGI